RVALGRHLARLQVVMPQRRLLDALDGPTPRGFDLLHPRRRSAVVDDRVRPAEAVRADDLLVVYALVLVAGGRAVGGVPLLRDAAQGHVARHGCHSESPPVATGGLSNGEIRSVAQ